VSQHGLDPSESGYSPDPVPGDSVTETSVQGWEFLDQLKNNLILKKNPVAWSYVTHKIRPNFGLFTKLKGIFLYRVFSVIFAADSSACVSRITRPHNNESGARALQPGRRRSIQFCGVLFLVTYHEISISRNT
jgi:hypothetical protein